MTSTQSIVDPTDMVSLIDYCAFFCVEKKKENGEDCVKYSYNRDACFFGVFDGCGGSGAQTCPKFHGKTEAYIASRVTADAFQDWFEQSDKASGWSVDQLKKLIVTNLKECNSLVGEQSLLVGGIKKKFPTTAAAGICYKGYGTIEADLFWVGDSRIYLLTPQGLAQLTEDDLGGIDAMDNLTEDGVLTNVISLSQDFTIHTGHISMDQPGIIFAATDGCFGYLSTPMEFEYLLLESMLNSDSVSDNSEGVDPIWLNSPCNVSADWIEKLKHNILTGWQEHMDDSFYRVAGDDYTICGYAIGFGSLDVQKKAFIPRANEVYRKYIKGIKEKSHAEKYALWLDYRDNYHRLLCRP